MTAPRFKTGRRHQTSLASLQGTFKTGKYRCLIGNYNLQFHFSNAPVTMIKVNKTESGERHKLQIFLLAHGGIKTKCIRAVPLRNSEVALAH